MMNYLRLFIWKFRSSYIVDENVDDKCVGIDEVLMIWKLMIVEDWKWIEL